MKKILIALLILTVSMLSLSQTSYAQSGIRIEYSSFETNYFQGMQHTHAVATFTYNGATSQQVFNYLGTNIVEQNYDMMVVDSYQPFAWGMAGLDRMINETIENYPSIDVVAGLNGDFYHINTTGQAINTHITNYEVKFAGRPNDNQRKAIGFKENGDLVFGTPELLGKHMLVLNETGELKYRQPINYTNQLPRNDGEISVYYEDFTGQIDDGISKVVIKGIDIKVDNLNNYAFAKGHFDARMTDAVSVDERHFVLVGQLFEDQDLILPTDTVLVQEGIGGDFADARFAIGAGDQIVHNAQPIVINNNDRHPRTAIGHKADGTVFFIVVDGRDRIAGKEGVTLSELGELMAAYGAETAYNLDGGGSSTMMLANEHGLYDVLNTLSDGRIRSLSNGILFTRGGLGPAMTEIPYPDTRPQAETPVHIYIDAQNRVYFDSTYTQHFLLRVNQQTYYIPYNGYQLNLSPGNYEIGVAVVGQVSYGASAFSETYQYNVHHPAVKDIIDMFRTVAQNNRS